MINDGYRGYFERKKEKVYNEKVLIYFQYYKNHNFGIITLTEWHFYISSGIIWGKIKYKKSKNGAVRTGETLSSALLLMCEYKNIKKRIS